VMSILIQQGAKLTRTDGKGNNIVHLMVASENSDVLKASTNCKFALIVSISMKLLCTFCDCGYDVV